MHSAGKVKNAVIFYLSLKVNPLNVKGLQDALSQVDASGKGELDSDTFIRCLSKCEMKFNTGQVDELIGMIKSEGKATVNYKDFLKYSCLFKLFKHLLELEADLKKLDKEGKGLIQVGEVQKLLEDSNKSYQFPPNALVNVFNEMLGSNLEEVDPACIIKIDAFIDSLKQQFEDSE